MSSLARPVRQCLAIAWHTFTEARRQNLFGPLVLLAVTIFLGALLLPSDETAEGRVRLELSVCLQVTTLFVTVLTILLAARTVSAEIESRTVYSLATKPVSHAGQIVGKFLGVVLTAAAGAALLTMATWVIVRAVASREAGSDERASALEREVFLAKLTSQPTAVEGGGAGADLVVRIPPQGSYWALFEVPRSVRPGSEMAVRLRVNAGLQSQYPVDLVIEQPGTGMRIERKGVITHGSRAATVYFPGTLAGPGETLKVTLINVPRADPERPDETIRLLRPAVAAQSRPSGIELAIPTHGFAGGLMKSLALLVAQMALLAAVTILAATTVSFPVAVTVGAFVSFVGHFGPFVQGLLVQELARAQRLAATGVQPDETLISRLGASSLEVMTGIFPDLELYSAGEYLIQATHIPASLVLAGVGALVAVRALVCVVAACVLYRRRELAL